VYLTTLGLHHPAKKVAALQQPASRALVAALVAAGACHTRAVVGDAGSSRGDAGSSLGDAESSLGDVKSSLGDAKSSLGGAESSLGGV
jgi:hypothetical protein